MELRFEKYQGAGNDFVMVDARSLDHKIFTTGFIKLLANRNYGVGADGVILLKHGSATNDGLSTIASFDMQYFNADGNESTMCGNGGRCIVAFANALGLVSENGNVQFNAIDGLHSALILTDGHIKLLMNNVNGINSLGSIDPSAGKAFLLDTGSPHVVIEVSQSYLEALNIEVKGRVIRYNPALGSGGANVNFYASVGEHTISLRTYERGVEAETQSCGTGTVASVLVYLNNLKRSLPASDIISAKTLGGILQVTATQISDGVFVDLQLTGPATHVFSGVFNCNFTF